MPAFHDGVNIAATPASVGHLHAEQDRHCVRDFAGRSRFGSTYDTSLHIAGLLNRRVPASLREDRATVPFIQ
jgi:hypothetical protein